MGGGGKGSRDGCGKDGTWAGLSGEVRRGTVPGRIVEVGKERAGRGSRIGRC